MEFQNQKDMLEAYKKSSGMKILNREIEVDCEYGRTRNSFRPRRFGGGLGNSRKAVNHPYPM